MSQPETNPEAPGFDILEGLRGELDKARRSPDKVGLFSVKSANAWIDDAIARPDPKSWFYDLIVQYENTVLFAQSNAGKTILAVQMAECIAREEKVLYIDLELADKQFQMRYTDPDTGAIHQFPENFMRAEIDPELIVGADLEEEILLSIEMAALKGTKYIFLDNLTFACNDSEKGATATKFMMQVIRLKKKYSLTTIVIAHTPKIRGYQPITQYDLAGSAKLISFFDAGIAVARSAKDNNLRYVKQVKVRTGEYKYDAENVMIFDVAKVDGFLQFILQDYAREEDHLKAGEGSEELDEIYAILRLKQKGRSLREIARTLDMSLGKVQRRLEKARKNDIKLDDEPEFPTIGTAPDPAPVSPVSPVLDAIQPIQPIQELFGADDFDIPSIPGCLNPDER